ncbi:DUF4055 domain-containing protein [Acinetobacter sp. V102_4]|uniref:DUF4055 domain-containing protein n=1 Tax=Acinetobacter sp. V102_4 TaxID=3072984 RepID=UPI00287C2245|nr:DUF4055 domain-containing protein [Acinetobacter sp. V102_4]MDS7931855.1 DUF4055 domain-containing protein [Acinetobacter sp. V102_4]
MAVTDKHPQYIAAQKSWLIMRDAVAGEEQIKQSQTNYLAKSAGMIEAEKQGDKTGEIYKAYLSRAQYPLWVQDSLRTMIGLVSKLEPNIVIESSLLKVLIDNATNDGFGLKQLFIRICMELLEYGRCGLMVDVDDQSVPYFALYDALSIINWKENSIGGRKDLKLLVLEEQFDNSEDEFGHDTKTVHRALSMQEDALIVRLFDGSNVEDKTPDLGGNQLTFIPFVFCGTTDNSPQVGTVPLLTMAKAALKYYQLSADYFQSLHHTAHPQPWVNGIDANDDVDISVTGVMAVWSLPGESECGYLEISGSGIELTKQEMDSQKNAALEAGAKVIDTNTQESGEARRARQDDQHASLHSIVMCAAAAIDQAIKYAAQWLKLDPSKNEFTVEPEFIVQQYDINMAKQLYEGAISGKNSFQTYWEYIATGKLPGHDYQEELKRVEAERNNAPL